MTQLSEVVPNEQRNRYTKVRACHTIWSTPIVQIAKNYELLLKNTVDTVEIVYSNIRNAGITGVVIAVRTGTNSKRRLPAQKKGNRYVGNRTQF